MSNLGEQLCVDAKVLSQTDNIILRCSPTVEQDDHLCRLYYFGKSHPDNYRSSGFLLYSYV